MLIKATKSLAIDKTYQIDSFHHFYAQWDLESTFRRLLNRLDMSALSST